MAYIIFAALGGLALQANPSGAGLNYLLAKPYTSSDRNEKWDMGLADGSWVNQRGTAYATGTLLLPKDVTVSMKNSAKLTHIVVGVPEFGSTKTISVSVSYDGKKFETVGSHDFAFGKAERYIYEFSPVLARFVKLTYLKNHDQENKYPKTMCFTTEVEAYALQEKR